MDNNTKARLLLEYHENGAKEKFERLFAVYGMEFEAVPETVFEEVSKDCDCTIEELKRLYESYLACKT